MEIDRKKSGTPMDTFCRKYQSSLDNCPVWNSYRLVVSFVFTVRSNVGSHHCVTGLVNFRPCITRECIVILLFFVVGLQFHLIFQAWTPPSLVPYINQWLGTDQVSHSIEQWLFVPGTRLVREDFWLSYQVYAGTVFSCFLFRLRSTSRQLQPSIRLSSTQIELTS